MTWTLGACAHFALLPEESIGFLYIFFFSKKYIFFLYHFYVIKKEVYERDSIKHCFITPLYTYGVSYLLGIT